MVRGIKPHVKIVQHPNEDIREFHVTREVCEAEGIHGFGSENHFGSSLFNKKKPGDLAKLIEERLVAIPGVVSGHFRSHSISVTKGDAFDWQDIGPVVLGEIVNAVFPETLGGTIEISVQLGWSYYVRAGGRGFMDEVDDGHRIRYKDTVRRKLVEVHDPQVIDLESLLGPEALQDAQLVIERETIDE